MPVKDCMARIVRAERLGPRLYVMELRAPEIARAVKPGQFVHLLVPGIDRHLLRRPFSVYARDAAYGSIELLYQTVGVGTEQMAQLSIGDELDLMGPIGAGWSVPDTDARILLVGGGVGAAPLYLFCEQLVDLGRPVDVVLGAQTEAALVCRESYERLLGREVACSTDDGSYGRAGFCTSLVEEALATGDYGHVAVCGPEALMRIVAGLSAEAGVACSVSLERRMACGVGACLSCAVNTTAGRKRACVDGPVFDAAEVVWE